MKAAWFVLAALACAATNASADVITFETFTGGAPALDGDVLTGQISGFTFTNATIWTAGFSLNEFEAPPHSGSNVVVNTAPVLSILLTAPATSVGAFVTYGEPVSLSVYDTSMNLIGTAYSPFSSNFALSGDPGSSPNEFISIGFPGGISKATFSAASPQSFVIDDLTVSSVPEPGTYALLATVVFLTAAMRRRRRSV